MNEHANCKASELIRWLQNGGVLIEPIRATLHALTRNSGISANDNDLRDMIGHDQRWCIDNIATASSSPQERAENTLNLLRRLRDRYEELETNRLEKRHTIVSDLPIEHIVSRTETAREAKTWIIRLLTNLGLDEQQKNELRAICVEPETPKALQEQEPAAK